MNKEKKIVLISIVIILVVVAIVTFAFKTQNQETIEILAEQNKEQNEEIVSEEPETKIEIFKRKR